MIRIFRYLKSHYIHIALIVVLLFLQAFGELSLPDYMSRIVNVGIQQGGIESALIEAMRADEYDKLKLILDDSEEELFLNNYTLMDSTSGIDYKDEYPALASGSAYILTGKDETSLAELTAMLEKRLPVLYALENYKSGEGSTMPIGIPISTDIFEALKMMSDEQVRNLIGNFDAQMSVMPSEMTRQGALAYVRGEYEALGADLDSIRSSYILKTGLMMVLIAFLSMFAAVCVTYLSARTASALGSVLRDKVFTKVTTFSNTEFDSFSTASLITRTTNDISQVQNIMVMMLRMVIYSPILGIGGIIKALGTNMSMAWIILLGVVSIMVLVGSLFAVAMPRFKKVQLLVDKVNKVMRESLVGMLIIRAFNTEALEEKKFDDTNSELTKVNLFVSRAMSGMMPVMMLIMNGVMLLIIWVGAKEIDLGNIRVGDMMAFMQYAMQIIMSFLMLSMVSIMLPRAAVSADRVMEVIEKDSSIVDPSEPQKFNDELKGQVEFRDVYFRYHGAEEDVLRNISFKAKPGEVTAFIGSTGSGKSTLINLFPRFYDATSGSVLIDGTDVRKVSMKDLREKIGYVPQKGILFSGTIRSNLEYGTSGLSEEALQKVARISRSEEFILEKEDTYDSGISQGGTNVSGGQKQRLSIGRALAKEPEIFIFDDSFSALDYRTERELRKALKNELSSSTLLIVAQRISTIMNADRIIVLDEGEIVGIGKHRELMDTCTVYREIAESQLSKEELA